MVVRTSHLVVAVILHVLVIGLLFVGFRCSRKVEPPPVIQATIVGTPQTPAKPEPPKEDPHKAEEEKRKLEEKKKAELEARKAEQLAKLKAQEETKKKAADDAKKKKQESESKAKEEQANKKKKEQKEHEDQLSQQLKEEESARNSQARATAQQVWVAQVTTKIEDNWLQPPGMADNFQCKVHVQLLPGGQVVGVTLMDSCGNTVLDDSVKRAVLKSDPLPTPADPSAFDRDITFTFCPSCK